MDVKDWGRVRIGRDSSIRPQSSRHPPPLFTFPTRSARDGRGVPHDHGKCPLILGEGGGRGEERERVPGSSVPPALHPGKDSLNDRWNKVRGEGGEGSASAKTAATGGLGGIGVEGDSDDGTHVVSSPH
eukprot:Hpha_TRINITY_DN16869_c1_g1::TRINITY_DN16869_c1_g1_i1::g.153864::m.153864